MPRVDLESAKALYPSCQMGVDQWVEFFGSPRGLNAMGSILYDIWDEIQSAEEYRRGKRRIGRRPRREATSLQEIFSTIFPEEFTLEPLTVTLPRLLNGKKKGEFAAAIPIDAGHFSRILHGQVTPSLDVIERIAVVAGVQPWYFPEWRTQYIAELMTQVMTESPHLSITAIKNLRHLRGGVRR